MELLFGDEGVDRKAGVRRVLGAPVREPAPVLGREMPWERDGLQGHHALLFDSEEQKFKLWYRASVLEDSDKRVFLCYAESEDGLTWERPSLQMTEFQGSRDNNIVREIGHGDSMFWNVVKDPDDHDPSRRYKAIGFDSPTASNTQPGGKGVYVGYSADGRHWPDGPKRVMSASDLTDADCILGQRDPSTGKWVAFFRPRTHPKRRFIGYAESTDFDHWTYPRMLLTPDAGDDEWMEFYGLTVACVARWRIGCLWVYHNNPEYSPMTIELVYSRDGLSYRRAMPGVQFLPLGPEGSFDSRMITTIALIPRDSGCLLYYSGTNKEHGSDRGMPMQEGQVVEGEEVTSGVGLARVTGLNFCGLRADLDGLVETKWLCNYGDGGVVAYAEVERDGWIRAEILDQYGNVIPGWDRERCRVIKGDGGFHRFYWDREELVGKFDQVSEAEGRIGHVVKLRFYLHRATLYGFGIGQEGSMPDYG